MNPERITELARETAQKIEDKLNEALSWGLDCDNPEGTPLPLEELIQSALETLAKEQASEIAKRDAALKVAMDALMELNPYLYSHGIRTADNTLTKIDKELAP